jgi:hypothetical protein
MSLETELRKIIISQESSREQLINSLLNTDPSNFAFLPSESNDYIYFMLLYGITRQCLPYIVSILAKHDVTDTVIMLMQKQNSYNHAEYTVPINWQTQIGTRNNPQFIYSKTQMNICYALQHIRTTQSKLNNLQDSISLYSHQINEAQTMLPSIFDDNDLLQMQQYIFQLNQNILMDESARQQILECLQQDIVAVQTWLSRHVEPNSKLYNFIICQTNERLIQLIARCLGFDTNVILEHRRSIIDKYYADISPPGFDQVASSFGLGATFGDSNFHEELYPVVATELKSKSQPAQKEDIIEVKEKLIQSPEGHESTQGVAAVITIEGEVFSHLNELLDSLVNSLESNHYAIIPSHAKAVVIMHLNIKNLLKVYNRINLPSEQPLLMLKDVKRKPNVSADNISEALPSQAHKPAHQLIVKKDNIPNDNFNLLVAASLIGLSAVVYMNGNAIQSTAYSLGIITTIMACCMYKSIDCIKPNKDAACSRPKSCLRASF